jgi:hypothetical protein
MRSALKRLSTGSRIAVILSTGLLVLGVSSAQPLRAEPYDIRVSKLDGKTALPDGDKIQMVTLPGGPPSDKVEITLKSEVTWWKGMQSGGIVLCQTQDSQNTSTAQFSVSDLKSTGLQLWKAKTFGIHANWYNITDAAQNMSGGNSYTFIWSKD